MATPTEKKAEQKMGMEDRFTKIETERYMYNPDKTRESGKTLRPLIGYLLNHNPMPPMDDRDWEAYVISTTAPTWGLNREKEIVDVPAGREMLIPATHQLTQFLLKAASHPESVFEMYIMPSKKIDIGGGKKMWTYELGYDKKSFKPRKEFGPSAMLGAPQLPPRGQDTAERVADGKSGDIPF
jgi:hypothetical protein